MSVNAVLADLRYLKRRKLYKTEKPFQIFFDIPEDEADQRPDNLEFEEIQHLIRDIRPQMASYSLDEHGFMVKNHITNMTVESFSDRRAVEEVYLPEMERLLHEVDNSIDRVYFFDWRLRSGELATDEKEGRIDLNNLTNWLHPARAVHVDQSPAAVLHRIELHLCEEVDDLLKGRVRVIKYESSNMSLGQLETDELLNSAWRPLADPVEDWPLAVCDGKSMPDEDLIECDQVRRKFRGATLYGLSSQKHRWHYLHRQQPHEVLLLKMFDSAVEVEVTRCPHGAFKHPNCRADAPPRRSIEVRALVFNYSDKKNADATQ